EALLPYVAGAMGGNVALLTDPSGSVIAAHGIDAAAGAQLDPSALPHPDDPDRRYVTSIDMRTGRLHVVGDPYTPFFGRDHRDVLTRLADLTDIALRRAHVTEAELRSAAEVQRAHDAMREFVSIASHDLRTPITVIKGFAEVLTSSWDDTDDEAKLTYIDRITRQANHLQRLADDLLTTSRIDAGAVEPHLEELDLQPLVERIVSDLGHDVAVDIEPNTVVLADEDHAARIVRNLLENASRYGAPPFQVTARPSDEHVDLHVRDHGDGVPPSFRPRLFERFARAEDAKEAAKGTGLGLAIVQGLARAGGGDVRYEPASPGACFVVRFARP
ncbi:MAG: sensor histidine kinase, partial [Actinomycetota bacterium]